jgi:cytidylate kinase
VALIPVNRSFDPAIAGERIDAEIRAAEVTRHVSQVAQMQRVRAWVNQLVRESANSHDIVVDGRDMGTVVFPDAQVKVFLVADTWERARRRLIQRQREDHGAGGRRQPTEAEIADEADRLAHRDAKDATQTARAPDAILIDTTYISQDEQVERIVALARAVRQRLSDSPSS